MIPHWENDSFLSKDSPVNNAEVPLVLEGRKAILLDKENFDINTNSNVFHYHRCGCAKIPRTSDRELQIEYFGPERTGLEFTSPDNFLSSQVDQIHEVHITYKLIEK